MTATTTVARPIRPSPAAEPLPPTAAPPDEPRFRRGHQRGAAIGELCRAYNARTPIAVLVASAFAASAGSHTMITGVALILSTYAIAAALNDRADVVSDRVNGRTDRPLVSGAATERDVRLVLIVAGLVATLAFLAAPQPTGLVITAAAAFIAWASACEPLHLQRRGFVGLVALAAGYFVLPIVFATGVAGAVTVAPLALIGAGVLAHKDVRDEVGDRASGKQTLLIRVGHRPMTVLAAAAVTVGTVALFATLGAGWWLVPAAAVLAPVATMAVRGHRTRLWLSARLAVVVLAVSVGWTAGALAG